MSGDSMLDTLVDKVAASAGYRGMARELIASVGARELKKRRSLKEAVKSAKSKLHQVAGAYYPQQDYARWLAQLREASAQGHEQLRAACREIMRHHASTRERLPILDDFYARTLGDLPLPHRVLDLGCGLNPLAIPWMPLTADAEYRAYDVYPDLAAFLTACLPLLDVRSATGVADLTAAVPTEPADVALLLKLLPPRERLDPIAPGRLLDALNAEYLLVSYPVHSLGGRRKGMVATYDAQMSRLLAGKGWPVERFEFATELAFRIRKEDDK
jgi:16S rRNA (guanine(1405)-N(7))-methyltransferase